MLRARSVTSRSSTTSPPCPARRSPTGGAAMPRRDAASPSASTSSNSTWLPIGPVTSSGSTVEPSRFAEVPPLGDRPRGRSRRSSRGRPGRPVRRPCDRSAPPLAGWRTRSRPRSFNPITASGRSSSSRRISAWVRSSSSIVRRNRRRIRRASQTVATTATSASSAVTATTRDRARARDRCRRAAAASTTSASATRDDRNDQPAAAERPLDRRRLVRPETHRTTVGRLRARDGA